MRKLVIVTVAVLALAVGSARSASATSFDLNVIQCNCLPSGSIAGTVSVTAGGGLVTIDVQLNAGLWFHQSGLDAFSFNGPAGLTASNITITNNGGSAWTFVSGGQHEDGLGTFMYTLQCTAGPNGCTPIPVDHLVFTVSGGFAESAFETLNGGASVTDFEVNVAQATAGCTGVVGGGNGVNQSTPSGGFAPHTSPCVPSQVPEPASMLLLGAGLLTIGYRLRPRRKS